MSFARSAITSLSTRQGCPATPQTSPTADLRQDRVRHGLQGVYVVHLQPLQHYPLHASLGEVSEPLDDLARRPGDDSGGEVIPQLTFELAVYVGLRAAEDGAGHQGPAHLFGRPPRLAHQLVEPGVEIHESLRLQEDGVPLVRIAGRQRQRPPHTVAPNDHRRPSWLRRARHEQGVANLVELAVERYRLIVAEQPGRDLEPLLEAGEAPIYVEHFEAEGLVLPFVPARAKSEPETSTGQVVHGGGLPGGNDRMPERDGRNQRSELYTGGILRQPRERRPQLQAIPVHTRPFVGEVVRAKEASVAEVLDRQRQPLPAVPSYTLLPLDHDRDFEHLTLLFGPRVIVAPGCCQGKNARPVQQLLRQRSFRASSSTARSVDDAGEISRIPRARLRALA